MTRSSGAYRSARHHIYSEQEIIDLLASARRLGAASSLRGAIFETLFGLIASTGLRIGEALSLKNADVDLKTGMLSIHLTKFGKSRQVPVHPSTLDALRRYRLSRDLAGECYDDDTAFFVGSRGRLHGVPLGDRQVHRVFGELRRQLGWPNRGSHHAARIHDLRHNSESRIIPSAAFSDGDPACFPTGPEAGETRHYQRPFRKSMTRSLGR